MAFPRMPRFVRNDAFGPTGHNNLIQRQDFLREFLGVEHDPDTGEHNTPNIARTLGRVAWSGAAYSLSGFNSDVSLGTGHNPEVGNVIITLAADRYSRERGIIELQPADESGNSYPWLASAAWLDDQRVSVRLAKNTAGLSVQQTFAAADGDFFIGIRSPRIPNSQAAATGAGRRLRGEGLRSADWNTMVQAMGDNRSAFLANHTEAGLHDCREVAKVCGYVRWTDTEYQVLSHRGLDAGVERIATGQVRVRLSGASPALVTPVQAFATAVASVSGTPSSAPPEDGSPGTSTTSESPEGLRIAMVPNDTCGTLSVDVFLYESYIDIDIMSFPAVYTYRWRAVDCDFAIRVHGT